MDRPATNALWDLERGILGALLMGDAELVTEVAAVLRAQDFHRPQHGALFALLVDRVNAREAADLVSVMALAGERGAFDGYGGAGYLAGHPALAPDVTLVPAHAERVKAAARRRDATMTLRGALERLGAGDELEEVSASVVSALAVSGDVGASGWRTMPDLCAEAGEEILTRSPDVLGGVPTGLRELDDLLWGLKRGTPTIVAGRPAMGKSAVGGVFARNAATAGVPVGIVSLEMRARGWIERLAVAEAGVDAGRAMRGSLLHDERRAITEALETLSDLSIFVDDRGGRSAPQIAKAVRRLVKERGAQMVVIDYLQLVPAEDPRMPSTQAVTQISGAVTALAKELDIALVVLSQLNRGTEGRTDHRPKMSDLRDSGAIEQDAGVVLFPFRPEVYAPDDPEVRGVMEMIIAKNRFGPTGTIRCACDLARMRITDLDRRW